MYKLFSIFFLLSLFTISLSAKDLNIDTIVANADHKPLFLFFHKPHCGHCKHMIEFTLKDPEIAQLVSEKFIYVDLYTGEEGTVTFNGFTGTRRALAQSLGYDFYPTCIFIETPNKKVVNSTPGAREQDYLIKVLQYVATKQYQEMEFETYLNTLDLNSDE